MFVAPARPAVRGLVAGGVVLLVLAASVLSGPGAVRALAGGGCASADSGHVGLVIDFGNVSGDGTRPDPQVQTACLALSSGETGDKVLAAAGLSLRWGSSGLLCAINGYPASGCGQTSAGGTDYWSYWHGGSAWTYSTTGPAFFRPPAAGVEGWRFVHVSSGGGAASAPVPSPEYAASGPCPTVSPTTVASPAPGPSPSSVTTGVTGAPAPTNPGGTRPSSSTTAASGGGSTPASPTTTAGGPTGTGPDDATRVSNGSGKGQQALPTHGEIVAHSHHGSPFAPLLVLAVIVALGVSTVVIRRRRSSS